jgi:hypothetical protein
MMSTSRGLFRASHTSHLRDQSVVRFDMNRFKALSMTTGGRLIGLDGPGMSHVSHRTVRLRHHRRSPFVDLPGLDQKGVVPAASSRSLLAIVSALDGVLIFSIQARLRLVLTHPSGSG